VTPESARISEILAGTFVRMNTREALQLLDALDAKLEAAERRAEQLTEALREIASYVDAPGRPVLAIMAREALAAVEGAGDAA
jgi:hypothetical protein